MKITFDQAMIICLCVGITIISLIAGHLIYGWAIVHMPYSSNCSYKLPDECRLVRFRNNTYSVECYGATIQVEYDFGGRIAHGPERWNDSCGAKAVAEYYINQNWEE